MVVIGYSGNCLLRVIFWPQLSDADGFEDGLENVGAGAQPCGIDNGANVGFALGRPHCAVAIGYFALDNDRSERPSQPLWVGSTSPG